MEIGGNCSFVQNSDFYPAIRFLGATNTQSPTLLTGATATMTINNGEGTEFTAPISVEIGAFDATLVDYVANSAASTDNTVGSANHDDSTGMLTFTLADSIAATNGEATVTFQMQKPVTP